MTKCPVCGYQVEMAYDAWEDMYRCPRVECWTFLYPEDIGRETNKSAPIYALGTK